MHSWKNQGRSQKRKGKTDACTNHTKDTRPGFKKSLNVKAAIVHSQVTLKKPKVVIVRLKDDEKLSEYRENLQYKSLGPSAYTLERMNVCSNSHT